MLPKQTLIQYLRKKNGLPYGVIVAVRRDDGEVAVDFSLCNTKKDRFTKERALEIAIGRAMSSKKDDGNSDRILPHSLYREMKKFNDRVCKYYRTHVDNIYTW